MVALYETHEAATFGNYNWTEWLALPDDERAVTIAHYRTHMMIEAHANDAISREAEIKTQRR